MPVQCSLPLFGKMASEAFVDTRLANTPFWSSTSNSIQKPGVTCYQVFNNGKKLHYSARKKFCRFISVKVRMKGNGRRNMEKVDIRNQKDGDGLCQIKKLVKLQSWGNPTDIFSHWCLKWPLKLFLLLELIIICVPHKCFVGVNILRGTTWSDVEFHSG